MLSGSFGTIEIESIVIHRQDRVRREVTEEAVTALADSISRVGLIHPVIITREYELVAGETRIRAFERLGYTAIPYQFADTLDKKELLAIELEENIKRTDLPWQDQCKSLLRFHQLHQDLEPTWTQSQTAEAIGISQTTVSQQLAVALELESGNERVVNAPKLSVAKNIVTREADRRTADVLASLSEGPPIVRETPILTADFNEWAATYSGPAFNLLNCDFPYGINADKFDQGAGAAFGSYEDTEEVYWTLLETLVNNRERLLGESAHIVFWFSMKHYAKTLDLLRTVFRIDPYPLVWVKSDNRGTLPDPTRGPRRVYEVAFLCSFGDRKIISAVANSYSCPTVRTGEHMSEKNEEMLAHFFRMFIDPNTRFLDPTCGSGSALRAARRLGATSILGLEKNDEFAENARRAWLAADFDNSGGDS